VHLRARLAASHLHKEGAALNSVNEDVARREHSVVGPGAEVVDGGTAARERVIFGVDVEESNLREGLCEQRTGIVQPALGVCGSWESFKVMYLADTVTGRILRDRRNVINAETSLVIALVNKTV
jgi:hypothetical protein